MFEYNYFDYYAKTRMIKNKPKVASEIELYIHLEDSIERKMGVAFSEERTWHNFLETDCICSDGTSVKNRELPDGRRVSEFYDSVEGEYEYKVFDNQGNLLIKDKCDRNGNYETAEKMPDGTLYEESGTSVFIRCINGKMI